MGTPIYRFYLGRIFRCVCDFVCLSCLAIALNGGQAAKPQIRGTVVDVVSHVGIPFAHVRLSLGTGGDVTAETLTDGTGKFTFRDVPKGAVTVSADKEGYVAVVPGGDSRLVSVADAEDTSIALSLSQTAVISGTVFDVSGQVVRGAKVAAMARRSINGVTGFVFAARPVETDDRGSYRIYALTPGRYSLVLLPDGDSPGSIPFAPVYFPGTIDPDAAQFLEVTAGASQSGADLTVLAVGGGNVHGQVTNIPSDWRAGQIAVTLLSTTGLRAQIQTVQAGETGEFDFTDVPPGTYQAVAWGPVLGMGAPFPSPAQHSEQGSRRIRVDGMELSEVEIPLHDEAVVDGTVRFEPGTNPVADCSAAGQLTLHPVDPMPSVQPSRATFGPSNRFVMRGVPTGSYTIELKGLTRDCFLTAVQIGQGKPQKGLISIDGDSTLTLFLGTESGEVAGTVVDANDRPVAGVTVQMVPTGGWGEAGIADVLVTSSGEKGQFSLERVPPGRYQLLPATEVLSTDYLDPYFRKDHGMVEVDIKPRERIQVVLRVSR